MKQTFLLIELILLTWLNPAASAQQASDSREAAPNPALARVQQLIALSASKDIYAPAKIKQALSDDNWYVRGEAARALGRLGDKSVGPLLLTLLSDQNWYVRNAALEAIASLGVLPTTLRSASWRAHPTSYVRARAFTTSAAINAAAALDSLIHALTESDAFLKAHCSNNARRTEGCQRR